MQIVRHGQAADLTGCLTCERFGFVELLLLDVNRRQDESAGEGAGIFLTEDPATQFQAAERQFFRLFELVQLMVDST